MLDMYEISINIVTQFLDKESIFFSFTSFLGEGGRERRGGVKMRVFAACTVFVCFINL